MRKKCKPILTISALFTENAEFREGIIGQIEYSEEKFDQSPQLQSDLTLSCLDLNKYNDVEESFGDFFNSINNSLTVTTLPEIVRERTNLRDFGSYSSDYNYGLIINCNSC